MAKESSLKSICLIKNNNVEVVKEAWFWTSVQYQSCALTKDFLLSNVSISLLS